MYRSCYDLPLHIWVEVNVTRDLKYLIKKGVVSLEELYSIWSNLNDEYRELTKDIDSNHTFDLYKEVRTDDQDIVIITSIVNRLALRRNETLIGILKNDFNFRFDYVDLTADLARTLTVAKARIVQLQLKEKDYKDLTKAETVKEVTKFDFIEQLVILSEDNHYRVDINTISVAEYIALYNKFKAKVEFQLQQRSHV